MVLFQDPLNFPRILTIYIAQGLVAAWFSYLAYKILKRDKKRLNIIFAGFYLSAVIGLVINFIYAPINNVDIVRIFNYLTNFSIFYSPIFLIVFNLILLKSEKVITTPKQLLLFLGFGIYIFCMIFFVSIPGWGVTINASSDWSVEWNLPFFLYVTLGETVLAVVPTLYLSFKVYNKFEDEQLKRKWKNFIFGICTVLIFFYGIFISNFLASFGINVRTVMGGIGILSGIVAGYLMYNGVGRQLEK